nr:tRNA (uridine(54)-C5)-methyltransferase TrmA [Agarilytica rhodophyticola]
MSITLGTADVSQYDQLFNNKIEQTLAEFAEFNPPQLASFPSPAKHFRMRAEFKIWHDKNTAHYAMYKQGEYKQPFIIENFDIGSSTINELMPKLLKEINDNDVLKRKLFQVEFLTTTNGDSVTTLIYHRALDDEWETSARKLQGDIDTKIIGRSRGQKIVLSEDFVIEEFSIEQKTFKYQQVETGFTQPNAKVCEQMLSWAQTESKHLTGDLLELYCGNGNFTLPLAQNFSRVLATEVSKTSVKSANYNIGLNYCDNITVVRMSSEEFTQAQSGVREFTRLRNIELHDYNFSTVFVDPPRAGLDKETEAMVQKFDNILYISCNPSTLKENLKSLCQTHHIKSFAFFDQFPYTEHRECGVLLSRKDT